MSKIQKLENEILAALDARLKGKVGTDYEGFLRDLPDLVKTDSPDSLERAFNNLLYKQQLRNWRPKTGAPKQLGYNPEYCADFALPSVASW